MTEDDLRKLLRRLNALEDTSVRYRTGVITDDSPLTVALGGADATYTGVRSLADGLAVDDVVGALVFSRDILILGRPLPSKARGTGTATWTASALAASALVAHGLGATPKDFSVQSRNTLIGYAVTADATHLDVRGYTTANTSFTGTLTFNWRAEL